MPEFNSDHDLLIELRTEVKNISKDIKEIKDNTASRLSALEQDKVTQKEFTDHEARLREVEEKKIPAINNRLSYWTGGLAVAQAVIAYVISKFLN